MTEEELELADKFMALSEKDKKEYLKENKLIIVGEQEHDDGSISLSMYFDDELEQTLRSGMNDGETFEEFIPRILTEHAKRILDASEEKKGSS